MRRGSTAMLRGLLYAVWCGTAWGGTQACNGAQNIRLLHPVEISPEELAEFHAMPPLRVLAVDAPPMSRYDKRRDSYAGVAVDTWCFITDKLGLHYEIDSGRDLSQTVANKIEQVQQGRADVFMPLSLLPQRARLGIFTEPYYQSFYAVITRKDRQLSIDNIDDLKSFQVGVVKGVALDARLQSLLPPGHLQRFDQANSDGLFKALQDGTLDAAVFSQSIFEEKRYTHEYFDLEAIHTLLDDPREYRFYFSPTEQNQRIVQAFDRYLAAMDVSLSVTKHEKGERDLIELYVKQRSQHQLWQFVGIGSTVLVLVFGMAFLYYRRLARMLNDRNRQIQEQAKALESANEQLKHLSLSDGLTGLANRRAFDQELLREHARSCRMGTPLSMLMADLDRFKAVNDDYGHATGDVYLSAVAKVLKDTASRATDLAARYGGEEFACLLPDTGASDALALAERIRQAVQQLALPNTRAETGHLTISIGLATLQAGSGTAQGLLEQADSQLYAAKHGGGNRVHATELAG
ncbi:MAG: GGDEF domain-containing protein [Comamonas sp.]|uniref:transporter substrate-binding domain-containing diguanylate cyclase n=1 Tax=Comamonas sp. TaxID=34028 RepID=UPI00283A1E71|nr:GGDEF domain-containing protein [Comamonas sp.]MDR0216498.1 GGDEF domain-containing protein [Comamonas sp.]